MVWFRRCVMREGERTAAARAWARRGPVGRSSGIAVRGPEPAAVRHPPAGQLGYRAGGTARSILRGVLPALQRTLGNQYLQRIFAPVREEPADPAVERTIASVRGGGAALGEGVRTRMETAFGADFSGVRIHTGATAHALNTALSARAFTTGPDIFFRDGAYDPAGSSGRRLLAHELAHVVQQSGAPPDGPLTVGSPGAAHEIEADRLAEEVTGPRGDEEADLP
ncbi:DUF4157 domain-containing protein [Streptomyces sp. NRRL F-5755]|uniref:eCIS core domain-containing protein n=1 Tax=Streptomyces sp. NRRL F-5755 TaxID=1519475 RepID=UPI00099C9F9D|nr:DUF4157 domain-containing protein [Streptomyces sp. NRRL F-5755]